MMKHYTVEQNTPEWFQLRAGRITMSELHKIMANYDKAFGDPAKKYAVDIAIEQITGNPVSSSYSNPHMERGHIQEAEARALYEQEKFTEIFPGGFFCNETVGYSPDGLLVWDGENYKASIEILSCISSVHFDNIKRQSYYPPKKWQLIGAMHYAKLEWIDFVSYCSDFPEGKQLYIYHMVPEDYQAEFDMIDKRVAQFLGLVEETKATILNSKYFL